ncbi:hypothetical protein HanXRQr2_Chr03g0127981 [Helianthus annuus]|uniref:Uncharacterized protein n=2 Tax=Helianthus annuus TaxID=4232 RepID=A0A9K3JJM3_HELAN|nr:hypothetical protein HanXRQr2_Chr03g0127981 [Helianthus annuus]
MVDFLTLMWLFSLTRELGFWAAISFSSILLHFHERQWLYSFSLQSILPKLCNSFLSQMYF